MSCLSRADLAPWLGAQVDSLRRAVTELRNADALFLDRWRIKILSLDQLQDHTRQNVERCSAFGWLAE